MGLVFTAAISTWFQSLIIQNGLRLDSELAIATLAKVHWLLQY